VPLPFLCWVTAVQNVNNKFSVKYYLNLVLIDEVLMPSVVANFSALVWRGREDADNFVAALLHSGAQEDRRYFKQQEIMLWRREVGP
jgi:hypothetical protein